MKGHTKRKINYKKTKKKNHKRTKLIGGDNNNNNDNVYNFVSILPAGKRIPFERVKLLNKYNEVIFIPKSELDKYKIKNLPVSNNNNNNNNNFVNVSPFQKINLPHILDNFDNFCWDFDDTLAHNDRRGHLSLDIDKQNISREYLLKLFYEPKKLIDLMLYLDRNGKKIFIMSFGNKYYIANLLNKLFEPIEEPKPDFQADVNVFGFLYHNNYTNGQPTPTSDPGYNQEEITRVIASKKVEFIQRLGDIDYIRTLFFDDDPSNTKEIGELGREIGRPGITAITVPGIKSNDVIMGKKQGIISPVPGEEPQISDPINYGFRFDILIRLEKELTPPTPPPRRQTKFKRQTGVRGNSKNKAMRLRGEPLGDVEA